MKVSKEQIEELKKLHGEVYLAEISWRDSAGEVHSVEFVHREPNFSDYETIQQDASNLGGAAAARNLAASIAVQPSGREVAEALQSCPAALDKWFSSCILPFFGGDVRGVKSVRL